MSRSKGWNSRSVLLLYCFAVAALLLARSERATASVTATIQIVESSAPGASGAMTIWINGMQETVTYDKTSTPASMASAFAARFSKNFLPSGLCASAKGNLITLKLKIGTFGSPVVTGSRLPFQIISTSLPTPPTPFTKLLRITNTGNRALTITGFSITGNAASDFTVAGTTCQGGAYAFGNSGTWCTVTIDFTPSTSGKRIASLQIKTTGDSSANTISIPLSGGS